MKPGTKLALAVGVAAFLASQTHPHHGHGLLAVLDSVSAVPSQAVPSPGSQARWARDVLRTGGWPRTGANVVSLEDWADHEDPWNDVPPDGGEYTKNPLNSTYSAGEIGTVNSVGVAIYPDWGTGVADTVATLTNGNYGDITSALASGNGLCGQSFAGLSTWSGGGYSSVC